jgi:hypothetical protein
MIRPPPTSHERATSIRNEHVNEYDRAPRGTARRNREPSENDEGGGGARFRSAAYDSRASRAVDDFKLGDAIGIAWLHDACGKCEFCITGWETLCATQHDSGYSVDGGFAQFAIASAAYAAHLTSDVDFYQMAPILCAGVTTYKGG